jgi:import inner membrane translocase subunit TIM23
MCRRRMLAATSHSQIHSHHLLDTSPLLTMNQMILPVRTLSRVLPRASCLALPPKSAFSTSCSRQLLARPKRIAQSIPQQCLRIRQPVFCRHASSAPTVDAAAAPAAKSNNVDALTWNRFLALRKQRRRISLVASILCAGAGAAAGITALSASEFDVMQFSIDPTFVIGGAFIASALLGWLAGPFFGNAAFNLRYKSIAQQIVRVCGLH